MASSARAHHEIQLRRKLRQKFGGPPMAFRWELGGSPPNPFPQAWRAPNSFFVFALLHVLFLGPGIARAEPRFGDSTWVAPQVPSRDEKPSDPGPRVAEPDHERRWETVLRTPF